MENDINMLSEYIMDLDNLEIEYSPKVIESLKEIREGAWSTSVSNLMLAYL